MRSRKLGNQNDRDKYILTSSFFIHFLEILNLAHDETNVQN